MASASLAAASDGGAAATDAEVDVAVCGRDEDGTDMLW